MKLICLDLKESEMKEMESRLEALNVGFELCKRELDQTRSKLVTQAAYDHKIATLSKKNEENMRLLDQKEEKIQQMEKQIKYLQGKNS